jgi:hypothetical protein
MSPRIRLMRASACLALVADRYRRHNDRFASSLELRHARWQASGLLAPAGSTARHEAILESIRKGEPRGL